MTDECHISILFIILLREFKNKYYFISNILHVKRDSYDPRLVFGPPPSTQRLPIGLAVSEVSNVPPSHERSLLFPEKLPCGIFIEEGELSQSSYPSVHKRWISYL